MDDNLQLFGNEGKQIDFGEVPAVRRIPVQT